MNGHIHSNHIKNIRMLVANKLKLRFTPDINFRADDTFDEVERINKLMNDPKVVADLKQG